jgi:hypothetical protein
MKREIAIFINLLIIGIFTLYYLYFFITEKKKKKVEVEYKNVKIGKFIIYYSDQSDEYLQYFESGARFWDKIIDNDIKIKIYLERDKTNPNFVTKTKLNGSINFVNDVEGKIIINCKMFENLKEKIKYSLIKHEICHVLGFGNIWEISYSYNLGNYLDKNKYPLTHEAYVDITEVDNDIGIPLENRGGKGIENVHWENEDRYFGDVYTRGLKNELMTSIIQEKNSLSLITIQNLKDIGWSINESFIPEDIDFSAEIRLHNLYL